MREHLCIVLATVVSLLAHLLVVLPGLLSWFRPLSAAPHSSPPPLRWTVVLAPPSRLAGTQAGRELAPSTPRPADLGRPVEAPDRGRPRSAAKPPGPLTRRETRPEDSPRLPDGYPVRVPKARVSSDVAPGAAVAESDEGSGPTDAWGEQGLALLEPPVLLKGPQLIPVPEFLRNRDGHFLLTLRCQVEVDGSAQVAVMEGTGAPDLDESVRASFSGLPWYRAELNGKPVAVTVRLVVEGEWKYGQPHVDWGGRIPHPQL